MSKFIEKIEHLSINFFDDLVNKLEIQPKNNQLLTTYGPMLEFAKRNKTKFDKTTLIGLAHMAYGWMPTMIQSITIEQDFIEWIKQIDIGCIDKSFLTKIGKLTNDSIVGASKLLHFLNPEMYPIYDSRVYKTISEKEKHNLSKDYDNYIHYTNKLRNLINNSSNLSKIFKIEEELINKYFIPAGCSKIRILEICLYASANNV